MAEWRVVPVDRSCFAEAVDVLTAAFFDDPLAILVEPDPVRRQRFLSLGHAAQLRVAFPDGATYGARDPEGQMVGVMSLVPPGRYPISTFRFLAAAPTFLVRCGAPLATLRSAVRGLRYLGAAGRLHVKGRHYYLMLLGVVPERHGQGVGRSLLAHAIGLAEREGVPVYLETNQETNIRFYERSGFEVTETIRPDPRGPSLWAMVRSGATAAPQ